MTLAPRALVASRRACSGGGGGQVGGEALNLQDLRLRQSFWSGLLALQASPSARELSPDARAASSRFGDFLPAPPRRG